MISCVARLPEKMFFCALISLWANDILCSENKANQNKNIGEINFQEKFEVITKKNVKKFFVIKPQFAYVNEIREGMIRVQVKETGKWGFIDINGEMKISADFDFAYNFSEGLAAVTIGKDFDGIFRRKTGFIDRQGKFVINPVFDGVDFRGFSEGRAFVRNSKNKWGVIDKKGNLIVDYKYYTGNGYSEGVAAVREKRGGKYFFIDRDGKRLSNKEFGYLSSPHEGIASFQLHLSHGKTGYVDKFGNIVIAAKFDGAMSFSKGLAFAWMNDGKDEKTGYIDKKGRWVIPPQFILAGAMRFGDDELASAMVGDKTGFIDRAGNMVIAPKFTNQNAEFVNGYAGVCLGTKKRYPDSKEDDVTDQLLDRCGLIDKQGNYVIAPEFEDQEFSYQNGMISFIERPSGYGSEVYGFLRINSKSTSVFSLKVISTTPTSDGAYTVSIETDTDTASLKINGEELGGRADGRYVVNRVARAGQETKLDIVAKDVYGNTDTKTITVNRQITESKPLAAALNPALVKKQPERDAVAIIIGIADYKNLPRADFANDDARVFYDYAIRALGVKPENIRLLVDADADDIGIYQAFKTWLPSRVRAGTDVYVYYSGHGLPTADGQGLYLLPQRAHRDFIDKTAITQAEINTAIQAAKPRSVTVFLDSCYSGQSRSGETLIASARPVALKAAKQLFPDSFAVFSASQNDQISSSSPDLKHGIFSYYLMRGMEGDADANRDGKITAGEMQAYLLEQVSRQAGMQNRVQQPQLIGDANRVLVGK